MTTFILTWRPDATSEAVAAGTIAATEAGEPVHDRWSVARKGGIVPGDRAFVMRQHKDRGLVAIGVFESQIYSDQHWADPSKSANYADVRFERWLAPNNRLPVERLQEDLPSVWWNRLQGSGVELSAPQAEALLGMWGEHMRSAGLALADMPDDVTPGEPFVEGAMVRVPVNRYERDPRAREACLAHWGVACAVCDFDFESVYGDLGAGYIHVHHVRDLSLLGEGYEVDPVVDLRPVCPNCHSMLHRERPAIAPEDLRVRLNVGPPP